MMRFATSGDHVGEWLPQNRMIQSYGAGLLPHFTDLPLLPRTP